MAVAMIGPAAGKDLVTRKIAQGANVKASLGRRHGETSVSSAWRRPGIEHRNPHRFEVADVPGRHGQTVRQRRRGDKSVALRTGIRNMQGGAPSRDCGIDRQGLAFKRLEQVLLQPEPQARALLGIAPFHDKNAAFQLEHRDDGKIRFIWVCRFRPRSDICVSPAAVAQFRPDVRVDQIGQPKSAGLKI